MRVLWICNMMLPVIAKELQVEGSVKEGWISGLLQALIANKALEEIQLGIAFPIEKKKAFLQGGILVEEGGRVPFYGFRENVNKSELYDLQIEEDMTLIYDDFKPDIVHFFGTEYPHTLAGVRRYSNKQNILIGIQGLCEVYTRAYMANLPEKIQKRVTFRDFIKKDSLLQQQEKFRKRGGFEVSAIKEAGHITGRTHWDKHYTKLWNPDATYHVMQETLRSPFYTGEWHYTCCEKHSIFLSQGDYPIKGLHYAIYALPTMLTKYPNAKIYVAGNGILKGKGLKGQLKLSSYGKFIDKLVRSFRLQDKIIFLGKLSAEEMKEQYLKSHVYVCPSSIENSPNSLGEAMMLGVPIATANVGGIASMIDEKQCYLYQGFQEDTEEDPDEIFAISKRLAESVMKLFSQKGRVTKMSYQARDRARITHNGEHNYQQLLEIYETIDKGRIDTQNASVRSEG